MPLRKSEVSIAVVFLIHHHIFSNKHYIIIKWKQKIKKKKKKAPIPSGTEWTCDNYFSVT